MPIGNNLYPPVVDNKINVFLKDNNYCRLYFSLSRFNNEDDIKYVLFSLKNFKTGRSILNAEISTDATNLFKDEEGRYYIDIKSTNTALGEFYNDTLYSIQLRFASKNASDIDNFLIKPQYPRPGIATGPYLSSKWIIENKEFLSEWSGVTFIKPILKPYIVINGFDNTETKITNQFLSNISGKIDYDIEQDEEEDEKLKKYCISIIDRNENEIYNSGFIYSNIYNKNQIEYIITKNTQKEGRQYKLQITCETENGYIFSSSYNYMIIRDIAEKLSLFVDTVSNNKDASIDIIVKSNQGALIGNFIISRSSNKDTKDFSYYEDIYILSLEEPSLEFSWKDYTAESGVLYKYGIQRLDYQKNRSVMSISTEPCMLDLDCSYLLDKERKLKIMYNSSISSFQSNFLDTKIDTIGSKYPFIVRTGAVEYKQFPISGLITFFCNEEGYFLNEELLYNGNSEYYHAYNYKNNINEYNDTIGERIFREKVIEFLQNGEIKLFKSGTEGNVLVRLMDVSFTPEQILNRRIYSFSATAYEIDECSIDNYIKYKIQDFGKEGTLQNSTFLELGQSVIDETFWQNDIISSMTPLEKIIYNKNIELEDKIIKPKSIKWIRINFNSSPKTIIYNGYEYIYDNFNNFPNQKKISGHLFFLKEKQIIVPHLKEYIISSENIGLLDLFFLSGDCFTIDYVCEMEIKKYNIINENYSNYNIELGQIQETIEPEENVFNIISKKYNSTQTKMYSLDQIEIECIPGAVFYIKNIFDKTHEKHIIGDTGVLKLYDEDSVIDDFYYYGVKFTKNNGNSILRENEYSIASELEDINSPRNNVVYSLPDGEKIYYNKNWYEFDKKEEIAFMPCSVIVNYIYEFVTLRGES